MTVERRSAPPVACARIVLALGIAAVASGSPLRSQGAQTPDRFEVVSIRKHTAACPAFSLTRCDESETARPTIRVYPGGRIEATAQLPIDLIRIAYGFADRDSRLVSGGPAWLRKARYDIIGLTGADGTPASAEETKALGNELLRKLLEERFRVVVRRTTVAGDVRAIARSTDVDSPTGLRVSTSQCAGPLSAESEPELPKCPLRLESRSLIAGNVTMAELAQVLSQHPSVQGTVVDQTGMEGRFDVSLQLTERGLPAMVLRNALRKQLGLELRSVRAPVESLVVVSATEPTEE